MNISQRLDERAAMLARLEDYNRSETTRQVRDRLVERWKKEYPDAGVESSSTPKPLMRMEEWRKVGIDGPDEFWLNDAYNVTVRRFEKDPVFSSRSGGMVQLGICAHDGTARHDWRDFQSIKNQLAGAECEAFELYPAESRLFDPSNYYTLWCFPGIRRINIGQPHRLVRDQEEAWAPQRKLGGVEESPSRAELAKALEQSVSLQAHYAKLLNQRDGGQRIVFESANQWLERLRELRPAAEVE